MWFRHRLPLAWFVFREDDRIEVRRCCCGYGSEHYHVTLSDPGCGCGTRYSRVLADGTEESVLVERVWTLGPQTVGKLNDLRRVLRMASW